MKVCVFGAGAVGGNLAVRMMLAGRAGVSVVARGEHLRAIGERGLTLHADGKVLTARPLAATDDPSTLPQQDCVIVTLKAHSTPAAAAAIARLLAPGAFAIFALNGIPWWWRYGIAGGAGSAGIAGPLSLLDPLGALWSGVRPEWVLGCVIDSSNEVTAPGVVLNKRGNNWTLGEPDGSVSERLHAAKDLLSGGGLNAVLATDIRREILCKLALNVGHSPVSALTCLATNDASLDAALRQLKRGLMAEVVAIAAAMGWDIRDRVDPDQATQPVGVVAGSRPSMLQDVMAGRPIEAEAMLGQPQAMAREAGVATPLLDVVCALARGRDRALRAR